MRSIFTFIISAVIFTTLACAAHCQSQDEQQGSEMQVIKARKVVKEPAQDDGAAKIDGSVVTPPDAPERPDDAALDANGGNVSQPYEDYDENTGMKDVVPSDTNMGID